LILYLWIKLWAVDADYYLCYRENIGDDCTTGTGWRRIKLEIQKNKRAVTNYVETTRDELPEQASRIDSISSISSAVESTQTDSSLNGSIYDDYTNTSSIYDIAIDDDHYETVKNSEVDSDLYQMYSPSETINFAKLQSNLKNLDFFIEQLKVRDVASSIDDKSISSSSSIPAMQPLSSAGPLDNPSKSPSMSSSIVDSIDAEDEEPGFDDSNVLFKSCDAAQCALSASQIPEIWLFNNQNPTGSDDSKWKPVILNSLKKRNQSAADLKMIADTEPMASVSGRRPRL
jgi:hypothetical protein